MLTLSSVVGKIASEDCVIRGDTFTLKALSAEDTQLILDALPEPQPPKLENLSTGKVAYRTDDPKYRANLAKQRRVQLSATLAAAMAGSIDLEMGQTFDAAKASIENLKAWAELAATKLGRFTPTELNKLADAYDRASDGAPKRAQEGLWRLAEPGHEDPPGFDLPPESAVQTQTAMKLRVLERFGLLRDLESIDHHIKAMDSMDPGTLALLIQYDRMRQHEDRVAMKDAVAQAVAAKT